MALVDLDRFKQVNDEHGHDVADRVLQAFAATAKGHTRAGDIACRYGGEEFVLLLPGANDAQAAARLGHLPQLFGELRFDPPAGLPFGYSFSAGVAVADGTPEDLAALLARADAALYAAKQAGRGRVLMAAPRGAAA